MSLENIPELTAIVQQVSMNREGLVADAIFPKVKTAKDFSYIDWSKTLEELKATDDAVNYNTDARELVLGKHDLISSHTRGRALTQNLSEEITMAGVPNFNLQLEGAKTKSLLNKLLISREHRAVSLALDSSKYTANTANTVTPLSDNAVIDGGLFSIKAATILAPTYDARSYLKGINDRALYAKRNIMITDSSTLTALTGQASLVGIGLNPFASTTADKLAAELGVAKIIIADAVFNNGLGTVNLTRFWPKGTILFTSSLEFESLQEDDFAFGFSAYTQDFEQNTWVDYVKGMSKGSRMQKIGHDLTEVVMSYKAATIVKITAE